MHGGSSSGLTNHVRDGVIDLMAGTLGGVANVYAGQPLDTVKVKVQTFPQLYTNWVTCLKDTYRLDGIRGLYAGRFTSMAANVAENAVLFTAYGYCQKIVSVVTGHRDVKTMTPFENASAGSLAAIFAACVLCPTELVKCRLQAAREVGIRCTPTSVCRDMWRERGIRGFFIGMTPTLAREVPGYFCFFGAYETSRYLLTKEGQSKDEIGSIEHTRNFRKSGSVDGRSICAMHTAHLHSSQSLECRWQVAKQEGVMALYKGLLPTLIRTCLASGCLFVTYEESKKLMHSLF
ncbi:hypothetical protein OSTOST_09332 [Ostertagia ostertagi]